MHFGVMKDRSVRIKNFGVKPVFKIRRDPAKIRPEIGVWKETEGDGRRHFVIIRTTPRKQGTRLNEIIFLNVMSPR